MSPLSFRPQLVAQRLISFVDENGIGKTVSDANPLPVNIGSATLSVTADGVEIKNDVGNPIPTVTGLSVPPHDEADLSYTGDNLTGVVYKQAGVTVMTLELTYSNDKLVNVKVV